MPREPRVLFVSKPIVPPWHDGSKNLVRDVALHLKRARPTVLTTPGADPLGPTVACDPVYRSPGRFAPGVVANARVLGRLVSGDPHDVWHFVFAPNAVSSSASRIAIAARRALGWKGRVVQTVASAPREFEGVDRLLFGDVVVALSEWTRARLIAQGVASAKLRVIVPCAAAPAAPSAESVAATRARYGLGSADVVLYPGDYEVSGGATTFADGIKLLAQQAPAAIFVFACRPKTPRAAAARAKIVASLTLAGVASRVRHVGEIDDLPALLAAARVIVFPVDDLYGKVDVPLVLIEALALGVPMVVARGGPLETITSARHTDPNDAVGLAAAVASILAQPAEAAAQASRGKALYEQTFAPQVVADRHDDLYEEVSNGSPPAR